MKEAFGYSGTRLLSRGLQVRVLHGPFEKETSADGIFHKSAARVHVLPPWKNEEPQRALRASMRLSVFDEEASSVPDFYLGSSPIIRNPGMAAEPVIARHAATW